MLSGKSFLFLPNHVSLLKVEPATSLRIGQQLLRSGPTAAAAHQMTSLRRAAVIYHRGVVWCGPTRAAPILTSVDWAWPAVTQWRTAPTWPAATTAPADAATRGTALLTATRKTTADKFFLPPDIFIGLYIEFSV